MKRAILILLFLLTSVKATFAGTNTPPVNDNFAKRLPISFRSTITNAAAATTEPGEPIHTTNFTAGSLWWTWTPTNTGTYRIQTLVDTRDSSLAIYTGTDLTNLTFEIRSELGGTWRDTAMIDFHADAETEYLIAATCLINDPLILEIHAPPANDSFSAALPLILYESQTNKFVITTGEPGEPSAFNGVSLSHSGSFWYSGTLWYSWTAPHSGPFIFRTHLVNPSFGNVLSAYTGSDVIDLNSVPSLHYEAQSGVAPSIAFRAQEGMSYHLALKSIANHYERTVTATILPGHQHDDITNAAPISGQFVVWTDSMFGATTEPGEDVLSLRPSIWSQWTAPDSSTYKLALPLGFRPGVYRGSNFTEITEVAEAFGTNITLTFTAEAGVSYKLRTTREHHLGGDFVLRLGPAVTNEFPASATELSGDAISVAGQNWTATTGPEQTRRTIWYKWTAPDHGHVSFSSAPDTSILSFHSMVPTIDSNLLSYHAIQASLVSGTNVAVVTAGVSYLFGVRAPFSTNIPFHLQFHPKALAETISGALYGGDAFWSPQTNVFFSDPDALQSGPLSSNQSAFIELVIHGPGTLRF